VPIIRQEWRHVSFLHWRYAADVVQRLVPDGLTVEQYDDSAWVSLTTLQMTNVRVQGMPAVPGLSTFPETNLRTYVVDGSGRPGLWFFSLDAASAWLTVAARLVLGAPYVHGALDIDFDDGIRYTGRRSGQDDIGYDVHIRPGTVRDSDELDGWLVNRWRAFTRHAGRLWEIPVRHESWVLHDAEVVVAHQSLTTAARLSPPGDLARVHYSPGVADVAFGTVRPVSGS
jgi:uncharacterized protein YqjF (DUF2071 family)